MKIPVLTAIIIIFIVWFQYEARKSKRLSAKSSDRFWQLEKDANLTRKADISKLDYIQVDIDRLPMKDHGDAAINSYRDIILDLSRKKIINLSGLTNTELKLKYGIANFNSLTEYDNNYLILVSNLQKWADCLYCHGFLSDAVLVLEYAVSCQSDVSRTYKLLAKIYKELEEPEKIVPLIAILNSMNMVHKDTIVNELNRILNS